MSNPRTVRAPRGTDRTCKSWLTEAAYRMIQNNLDPEVAERPEDLVVYGGRGQAARNWECFDAILAALRDLEDNETLLVQSGKPVAVFGTHRDAPRVLIANSNLVPHWATQEHFDQLAAWELGIGSCLATIYEPDAARRLLGFPDEMHLRIALSFGYPADPSRLTAPPQAGGRRPYVRAVHNERWTKPT